MRRACILLVISSFISSAFFSPTFAQENNRKIIGYYTSWSIYARDYHVPDIPAEKITHINYAFANIAGGEVVLGDYYADVDRFYPGDSWDAGSLRGCFHRLQVLKEEYPHIKTLISIGGWTWSSQFSDVALTENSRQTFAQSCAEFVELYEFDGVDIDWEYPVEGGLAGNTQRPEDCENFTLLMAAIRAQLDSLGQVNGNEYLLTAAVSANPTRMQNLELDLLPQYVDWLNIMTYDFHGPWGGDGDPVTNFNSALYTTEDDPTIEPFHSEYNLSTAIHNYIEAGVPIEKINAGLPFYGRGFGNVENTNNGLYANYTGGSSNGTWENANYDYQDLEANYVNMNGYTRFWHEEALVPWLYNPSNGDMISYDDSLSIAYKCQYILEQDIGGAMFWEFSGDRNEVLLDAINSSFQAAQISVSPDTLNFGEVEIAENREMVFTINNLGGETLTINEVSITGECFSIDQTDPFELAGHESLDILVVFSPLSVTDYSGQVAILSNDANFPETTVALTGAGWEDTAVETKCNDLPSVFSIDAIYPNPCNSQANISVNLPQRINLQVTVSNYLGQTVINKNYGSFLPGNHRIPVDLSDLSSGIYFVSISTGVSPSVSKKIIFIK